MQDYKTIARIYNAFKLQPLEPDDPAYVDCRSVRGDRDIWEELGTTIVLSEEPTCQLYTGHRGVGKSTEMRRLRQRLEEMEYCVVYFEADEADIEPEDTQYTDILLACTRHVLEQLKEQSDPKPLLNWLQGRWDDLKKLALTEVEFESLSVDLQIAQFGKLTANLRAVPNLRRQIRDRVDSYSLLLVQALNEFITQAKTGLPESCPGIVILVDNLDRMVQVPDGNNRTNYQQIFVDRNEQLRSLQCDIIYTVPIAMLYSTDGTILQNLYDCAMVLPMIMVKTRENEIHTPGLDTLKTIIRQRFQQVDRQQGTQLAEHLETQVFDEQATLETLCLVSGGQVRDLFRLLQDAVKRSMALPISAATVKRTIAEARDFYRTTIQDNEWDILAQVAETKEISSQPSHLQFLKNRCLLEYRYIDQTTGRIVRWRDIHPLIEPLESFQAACRVRPQHTTPS